MLMVHLLAFSGGHGSVWQLFRTVSDFYNMSMFDHVCGSFTRSCSCGSCRPKWILWAMEGGPSSAFQHTQQPAGGILVREGQSTTSKQLADRLSTGNSAPTSRCVACKNMWLVARGSTSMSNARAHRYLCIYIYIRRLSTTNYQIIINDHKYS